MSLIGNTVIIIVGNAIGKIQEPVKLLVPAFFLVHVIRIGVKQPDDLRHGTAVPRDQRDKGRQEPFRIHVFVHIFGGFLG